MIEWNDPKIKYVGRWKSVENGTQNIFGGFCEIRFSGSTSVSVKEKTNGVVAVSVDGAEAVKKELGGGQTVIADGLSVGEHTLRVFTYSQHSRPLISGFVLDKGARLLECKRNTVIEFIGDSVTEGYTGANDDSHILSYAHLTAEKLGYDRNIVALGGITITPGYGYFTDKSGMVNRYFKSEMYGENSPEWDTSKFVPDIIVINLGTNDRGQASSEKILAAYTEFLKKLRAAYPKTPLFVMTPFCHNAALTLAVEKTVADTDVGNVFLVETSSWGIDPGSDNTHPPKEEHIKAAQKLADVISYYTSNGRLPEQAITPVTPSQGGSSADNSSSKTGSGKITDTSSDGSADEAASSEEADASEADGKTDSRRKGTSSLSSKTDNTKKNKSDELNKRLKILLCAVSALLVAGSAGFLVYELKSSGVLKNSFKKREKAE